EQSIPGWLVAQTTEAPAKRAMEYEDEVLRLLDSHGARRLYRGRRRRDQDESLPFEIQLLSFPRREALDAFLADDRRQRLLAFYGDVFTLKQSVELDTLDPLTPLARCSSLDPAHPRARRGRADWLSGRPHLRTQALLPRRRVLARVASQHRALAPSPSEVFYIGNGGPATAVDWDWQRS